MKKLGTVLAAAALACSALLTSCGSFDYAAEDCSKYVNVNIPADASVTRATVKTVGEDDIADQLKSDFSAYVLDTEADADYAAQDGDTVVIDYVGTLDGVAFDGGTATGAELELGSDSYIDGFEDGLVGAKAGEARTLNLTFPDPYENNPDLAGKAVVFNVTVNSVKVGRYNYSVTLAEGTVLAANDNAIVDFVVTVDGKEADSDTKTVIVAGKENTGIIDGLSMGLVGAKVGEETTVSVTFPTDYAEEEFAGKTGTCTFTVKSANKTVVTDVVDDGLVVNTTDFTSLSAYVEEKVKPTLETAFAKEAKTADYSGVWKLILDNSTVVSYPAGEIKRVTDSIYDAVAGSIGSTYGLSMREYVVYLGYNTVKEFRTEYCQPSAEKIVKEKLVMSVLVARDGIALTDEEKAEGLKAYYGDTSLGLSETYTTYEDFQAAIDNGTVNVSTIYDSLLWEKVVDTYLNKLAK